MGWNDFLKPVKSLPVRSNERSGEKQWQTAPVTIEGARVAASQTRSQTLSEKLSRTYGLHSGVAALSLTVGAVLGGTELIGIPLMLTGAGAVIEPTAIAVGLCAAVPLAAITFMAQQEWSGDTRRNAAIKAAIVGLLCALPGGVLGYRKLGKIMSEL
jgi:hypothetical protein